MKAVGKGFYHRIDEFAAVVEDQIATGLLDATFNRTFGPITRRSKRFDPALIWRER